MFLKPHRVTSCCIGIHIMLLRKGADVVSLFFSPHPGGGLRMQNHNFVTSLPFKLLNYFAMLFYFTLILPFLF